MSQPDIKSDFRTILMGAASLLCAEADKKGFKIIVDAHVSESNLSLVARYEPEELEQIKTFWFSLNSNNEIALDDESKEAFQEFYAE